MELRSLYYFLTVAREENITRASEVLHITQPTLSRQLIQLEEDLGTQLIIRGKRKIQLTEAGMRLRRRAEEILNLVDKAEKELINDEHDLIGEIMIGCAECQATHHFLPEMIQSFVHDYPQVTYDLYTGNADLIKEKLDQGFIDIGILLEPVDVEKYDFVRLLQKERWGIVVSCQHELASYPYVKAKDLLSIPLLNTNRSIVQNEIASWFQDDYEKLHFVATYNLISNVIPLVEKGIGSVITIEGAIDYHNNDRIQFIPFYPELTSGCVCVWKKHQILSPAVKQFIDNIYHALNV